MKETKQYSLKKRLYVWWYYHWKILFAAIAALILLTAVIVTQTERKKPDYQFAVVSSEELPVHTQEALIRELTPFGKDVNHDGRVIVQLNSYRAAFGEAAVASDAYDQMSGIIKLSTDLNSDDGSYIFLFRDPEGFEDTTRCLQYLDGTAPASEEEPVDVSQMCYAWNDCPVLASLSLGSYKGRTLMDDQTGENQAILSEFYIGRRTISTETQKNNHQSAEALWQKLTENAKR